MRLVKHGKVFEVGNKRFLNATFLNAQIRNINEYLDPMHYGNQANGRSETLHQQRAETTNEGEKNNLLRGFKRNTTFIRKEKRPLLEHPAG